VDLDLDLDFLVLAALGLGLGLEGIGLGLGYWWTCYKSGIDRPVMQSVTRPSARKQVPPRSRTAGRCWIGAEQMLSVYSPGAH